MENKDIDEKLDEILDTLMMEQEGTHCDNPKPYIKEIKQLMAYEFEKMIGEEKSEEWRVGEYEEWGNGYNKAKAEIRQKLIETFFVKLINDYDKAEKEELKFEEEKDGK